MLWEHKIYLFDTAFKSKVSKPHNTGWVGVGILQRTALFLLNVNGSEILVFFVPFSVLSYELKK